MTDTRGASPLRPDGVVVVIGGGRTAAPIAAALTALPGAQVRLCARRPEAARAAAHEAAALGGHKVHLAAIEPAAFADAALVVESVAEALEVKRSVLSMVDAAAPSDAIIATNTSSLSLAEIATALARPERFAGLHFLHPAQATAVVEVVAAPATSSATLRALADLVVATGKRPIVVRHDVPGFVWNRLQFALLRECLHLLEEGVADAEAIDAAVADGLAPRWMATGPLATVDLGGVETFATIAAELNAVLSSAPTASSELTKRATAGETFHEWTAQRRRLADALREEALTRGADIARRRREIMGESE